jgi:hypothetical protein
MAVMHKMSASSEARKGTERTKSRTVCRRKPRPSALLPGHVCRTIDVPAMSCSERGCDCLAFPDAIRLTLDCRESDRRGEVPTGLLATIHTQSLPIVALQCQPRLRLTSAARSNLLRLSRPDALSIFCFCAATPLIFLRASSEACLPASRPNISVRVRKRARCFAYGSKRGKQALQTEGRQ